MSKQIDKIDKRRTYDEVRLILGDQLNASHSWYRKKNENVIYIIAELHQEQKYVTHHIQKTQAFFAAMQAFAEALTKAGHHVLHLTLDDTEPFSSLPELITYIVKEYKAKSFTYQHPDEYRLAQQLKKLNSELSCSISSVETEHFYLKSNELNDYFKKDTGHRLESFYRKLRQRFNILMDGNNPEGGQWNYDKSNRNKLKKDDLNAVVQPLLFSNDVTDINARLKKHEISTIGTGSDTLLWPITRTQAKELLRFFCDHCLELFGEFQDAMTAQIKDRQWSLYHSRISFALNAKILSPQFVVEQALKAYQNNPDKISIEQVEGFVRQILGWREFVRGIYWLNMPDYKNKNFLNATRDLPEYFWTGNTKMNCLKHAIDQSLDYAYAHHIQRLMVTGNFMMLTGINPDQVDEWYLGIYIDAIEWVELPNTRGMSQFADGGIVGSKAYAASGNYIQKMTDYCSDCHYNVKLKTEDNACPLNSLYWYFMDKHKDRFGNNPRTTMVYRSWEKKSEDGRMKVINKAEKILTNLANL